MIPEDLHSLEKDELIALVLKLSEQLQVLQARIEALEAPAKTPRNSSLPPSKGHKSNLASGKKRTRGKRKGISRVLTENPDYIRDVFAETCSNCNATVSACDHTQVHAYDHIDLPPIQPITTRVCLHSGHCPGCGARIKGQPPADMPLGSPFGPGIAALVVYLHSQQMISYVRLREVLHDLFSLEVSEGAIANMLKRSGVCFSREAERIEAHVRNAPVIASDETSARVMGQTCWQWVFASSQAVTHRIAVTRGKAVVADFLDGIKPQVWVSDRYGGQLGHAYHHQACLAHLLRDAQYAIDAGDTVFAPGFRFLLKRALAIGRRRDELKDTTLKNYQRDLLRHLDRLLACKPDGMAGIKFRNAMEKAKDNLFVFITRRDVPPTNNLSERLLRMSGIFRKVTNGFRSVWGAQVYADICSVTATAKIHGINALDAIRKCLAGYSIIPIHKQG